MNHNLENIDKIFSAALDGHTPAHTPAEMHAGWQAVQQGLAGTAAGTSASGSIIKSALGKWIGLGLVGASVVGGAILISLPHPATDGKIAEVVESAPGILQQPGTPFTQADNQPQPIIIQGEETQPKPTISTQPKPKPSASRPSADARASQRPQMPLTPKMGGEVRAGQTPASAAGDDFIFSQLAPVCIGQIFQLQLGGMNENEAIVINWGDGDAPAAQSPYAAIEHTYKKSGRFTVTADAGNRKAQTIIEVLPAPMASFASPSCQGMVCRFSNQSSGAIGYNWDFGDGSPIHFSPSPSHTYRDTGRYTVKLIAMNAASCTDTIIKEITISAGAVVTVPNVFTPNGDAVNAEFKVEIQNPAFFRLTVYDRNGTLVWKTTQSTDAWDGSLENNSPAKPGVYYYSLEYALPGGQPQRQNGSLTLIR